MKISLIQINSGEDKKKNFLKTLNFLSQAFKENPDVICLPEAFLYSGEDKIIGSENLNSRYIAKFKELARTNRINLILGSLLIKSKNSKNPTNTSLIINRKGEIFHRYDKVYMYDVEIDGVVFRESNFTAAGESLGFFNLEGVKVGIGICYDLRYPEYFRALVKKGAEIIFLPASFREKTGHLAYDILTRARAIENQVYFCACNQTGGYGPKEKCGNTRIISYDGKIIENIESEEGIIGAELDFKPLRDFRKKFPTLKQIKNFVRL